MTLGLYSGLGGNGPSAHSDILTATPDNIDSQRALVEEIKRRGRATVGSKNYPDADALYGKGIDILSSMIKASKDDGETQGYKKEVAVFHSNRSLVRLSMGKVTEALEDADAAVEHDNSYVKAHWRQGQAFTACGRSVEALKSFEKALMLEPANKALKKEVAVAKERKEQEEKLMAEAAAKATEEDASGSNADESGDVEMKDAKIKPPTIAKTKKFEASDAKTKSSSNGDTQDDSLFTKSDHVRGYKIRSDGKKTSYFDREISEETKRLIGDIAPKKIDPNAPAGGDDFVPKPLPAAEGTSAWNKAGG